MNRICKQPLTLLVSLLVILLAPKSLVAQATFTSDELFNAARKEAFETKNYKKATVLAQQALVLSPNYTDIQVFLGRLYTWSGKTDSARIVFKKILAENPLHEETLQANFDLEYWNDRYPKALELAEVAVSAYPNRENFTTDKVKALRALGKAQEALSTINAFLTSHPSSTEAEKLQTTLKNELSVYKIGLSYTFTYFDKRFSQPWHLAAFSLGKQSKWGSLNLGFNYAHRFGADASELEIESYPSIAKGWYAYVGGATSLSTYGLFAKYRIGFSLYKSLPHGFELEAGLRQLRFSDNTTVYVGGLGKYLGNSFVQVRSYLTPSSLGLSKSFSLSSRIYLSDNRFNYIGFNVGSGVSPDDQSQVNNLKTTLKAFKVGSEYSRIIRQKTTLSVSFAWINEEYQANTFGNQFGLNFGIQRRFR
ncbi:MAG: YaiO family outer membrane beta-barrel protein [Sphingobacteriaceae bacterium]